MNKTYVVYTWPDDSSKKEKAKRDQIMRHHVSSDGRMLLLLLVLVLLLLLFLVLVLFLLV